MNQHSHDEHQDDAPVLPDHLWHQRPIPLPTNLVDHVLGRAPSLLVGLRRIKVGSAAEEKTGESDEYECHQHRPGVTDPSDGLSFLDFMEKHPDESAQENYHGPPEEHIEHRRSEIIFQSSESGHNDSDHKNLEIGVATGPESVDKHSKPVKTSPDHEIPAGSVPETSKEHGVHPIDVRDELLPPAFLESDEKGDNRCKDQHAAEHPPAAGQGRGKEGYSEDDGIRSECAVTVTSKGNIQVILQPLGK